jgi:tetrahydromethanopterin S-methyltransferase subunit C
MNVNNALANVTEFLNGMIALFIIVSLASFGYSMFKAEPILGLIVGVLVGIVVAAMTCGVLSLVIDIRNQLKRLNRVR